MAERPAFTYALAAVVGFVKDEEDVTFALYRIAYRSEPITDPSPASKPRAFNISLKTLLSQIKSDADADLAALRISEKLESLPTSSVTSQQSGSSQQAISSSSPSSSAPSFAEVNTSVLPAEAEPTAPVESQVPESPSTDSAVSTAAQSQQSSASTEDTTSPPSTEAKSSAPVESELSQSSPTTASDADVPRSHKPSASAQDTISPPSAETKSTALSVPGVIFSPIFSPSLMISALGDTSKSQRPSSSAPNTTSPPSAKAESPSPAQSEPVNPSSTTPKAVDAPSTTPAHSNSTQTQQISASTAGPQLPSAQPNGPLNAPSAAQPQQSLAPATTPQPSSTQPSKPRYSADQLTPSPYSLQPTYSPTHGAPLAYELAVRVGTYQGSTCVVTSKLVEHGGRNHNPPLKKGRRVPKAQKLHYLDYFQNERSMDVQREKFKDHNGWDIDIPRISCNQYLELYNSMIYHNPDNLKDICRKLLIELEIAIADRAEVYKWYQSLPSTDGRVAYNPRHLAFLQMLEKLESAINRYLHTGTRRLIRR